MLVPKDSTLFIVLGIVEHLLRNLYIIDRVSESLETVIDDYKSFDRLVWKMVKTMEEGQEKNIREILGKHVRRVGAHLYELEAELIQAVTAGKTETVKLGKVEDMGGQKIQYYLRGNDEEFDIPDFADF